jgi:DNA-binding PadR family transcriptional regulator
MHGHEHGHEHNRGHRPPVGPWIGSGAGDPSEGAVRGRGRDRGRGRGPEGFGPGWGFGRGFGRGQKVGRGDVRAAILALLAEEPMHGYQIITELTERSEGQWRPSPGSVYPTLQALEDQGLVTADKTEGRRVFRLTPEGKTEAEAAGDGPAPWEVASRGANRSLVDLRSLMAEVAAATMQVGRAGSESQVKTVAEILAETRRRIYLILADGSPTTDAPDQAGGTGGTVESEPGA